MRSLFLNHLPGCRRVVVSQDGSLRNYFLFPEEMPAAVGSIFFARVTKVAAGIGATFVALNEQERGFLNTKGTKLHVADGGSLRHVPQLKEGQGLLVQLQKPAIGEKLPTLGAEIKLVGFYGILFPLGKGVRFSRDFKGDKEVWLSRMAALTPGEEVGWLIRSAASEVAPETVLADGRGMLQDWRQVQEGLKSGVSRVLLHEDPIKRLIREGNKTGWRSIICDSDDDFSRLSAYLKERAPALLPALKRHDSPHTLFDTYRLEDEIAQLNGRRVWLKSGGTLDITRTEAMVTIDVNTARGKGSGKSTSVAQHTNLEAAGEIGRQIIARNLAGLIVIDFVGARDQGWRTKVDKALARAFFEDTAHVDLIPINKLGVAMIARERGERDQDQLALDPCPRCQGEGRVPSLELLAVEVQRRLVRQAPGMEGESLEVAAGSELAAFLQKNHARLLAPLERRYQLTISVRQERMAPRAYDL